MKNVKCKNCAMYFNEWCGSVIDSPDPNLERDCPYFIQKTNYSKIKAMDINKLAGFLVENGWDCNNCSELQRMQDSTFEKYLNAKCDEECVLHCEEWLKQQASY